MNKSEAIRAAIKANAREAAPYIFTYPGGEVFFDGDGYFTHEAQTQKAVFGFLPEVITPEEFKKQVAKARAIAMTELKMISADLILISEEFIDKHGVCVARSTAEDGRIWGMTMRSAKSLYLGAYFMITDCPEEIIASKVGIRNVKDNNLIDIMKRVMQDAK